MALNQYEMRMKKTVLSSLPCHITIDPGNFCNLRCPGCHTGIKHPQMMTPSFLKAQDYKVIFDQVRDHAFSVALYNWGEPFLNKQLFDIIGYTTESGVGSTIHSNFNLFSEKMAEHCVHSGLTHIYLSIDGATQESYEKYRVKGKLDQVLENLKMMVETKKRLKSRYPIITWKFLVFEHNKHEAEQARRMAKELGADEFEVFHGSPQLCDIYTFADDYRREPHRLQEVPDHCSSLWSSIYVNSDGTLFPCSLSFRENESFGNLLHEDLKTVWNNPKYVHSRAMFGNDPFSKDIPLPCRGCRHYLKHCGFLEAYKN